MIKAVFLDIDDTVNFVNDDAKRLLADDDNQHI